MDILLDLIFGHYKQHSNEQQLYVHFTLLLVLNIFLGPITRNEPSGLELQLCLHTTNRISERQSGILILPVVCMQLAGLAIVSAVSANFDRFKKFGAYFIGKKSP